MARKKATTPEDINKQANTARDESLMEKIVKGNAVLVLGHEYLLSEEKCGTSDSRQFVTQDFFEEKRLHDPANGYHYASFDEYRYKLKVDLSELKIEIAKFFTNVSDFSDESEYSPKLFELLRKRYFQLVLTTTYDYYVEEMLRKAWAGSGKELRVCNIFDKLNSDILESDEGSTDIQPTLYYVFGRADEQTDFVVTENDAMNAVKKWLSNEAPQHLITYLQGKTILAIGTKFDDWLFRFFWFILHRDINELNNGQVAISFNEMSETDNKLKTYLDHVGVQKQKAYEVIETILANYDLAEQRMLEASQPKAGSQVFLSYHSAAFEQVKHLYFAICEYLMKKSPHKAGVWFDHSSHRDHGLVPGDFYTRKITDAINKCRVFVPVITRSVVDVLQSDDDPSTHFFFHVEWQAALFRRNMAGNGNPFYVMPILLDGIEYAQIHPTEKYKAVFNELTSDVTFGSNRLKIEFEEFLSQIEEKL